MIKIAYRDDAEMFTDFDNQPENYEQVLQVLASNNLQSISYPSKFMRRLLEMYKNKHLG